MQYKTKRKPGLALALLLMLGLVLVLSGMRRHSDTDGLPEALRELYDRNPEAREFVLDYEKYKDADPVIDLSGEIETGQAPLLLQWDLRWGYRSYNGSFLACTGCGPTVLSMAVIGLTGDLSCDPWRVAQYAEEGGYNVPGSGTSWRFIPEGAVHYGLSAQELPLDESCVTEALDSGELVVIVVGPGDFTTTGHYLLLTGVEDGGFRLNDPNSPKNSKTVWSWARLSPQIQNLWALG